MYDYKKMKKLWHIFLICSLIGAIAMSIIVIPIEYNIVRDNDSTSVSTDQSFEQKIISNNSSQANNSIRENGRFNASVVEESGDLSNNYTVNATITNIDNRSLKPDSGDPNITAQPTIQTKSPITIGYFVYKAPHNKQTKEIRKSIKLYYNSNLINIKNLVVSPVSIKYVESSPEEISTGIYTDVSVTNVPNMIYMINSVFTNMNIKYKIEKEVQNEYSDLGYVWGDFPISPLNPGILALSVALLSLLITIFNTEGTDIPQYSIWFLIFCSLYIGSILGVEFGLHSVILISIVNPSPSKLNKELVDKYLTRYTKFKHHLIDKCHESFPSWDSNPKKKKYTKYFQDFAIFVFGIYLTISPLGVLIFIVFITKILENTCNFHNRAINTLHNYISSLKSTIRWD